MCVPSSDTGGVVDVERSKARVIFKVQYLQEVHIFDRRMVLTVGGVCWWSSTFGPHAQLSRGSRRLTHNGLDEL